MSKLVAATLFSATVMTSSLAVGVGSIEPAAAVTSQRRQAWSADWLVDSVGVNVHVSYNNTPYFDLSGKVIPALQYLGVRHVRSGIPDKSPWVVDRHRQLQSLGFGVTGVVPYKTENVNALVELIKSQWGSYEMIEGPNETDQFSQFAYKGQKFPQGTINFMRDFYAVMKADDATKWMPILQTTLALPENKPQRRDGITLPESAYNEPRANLLGDLSAYADFGNSHNYFAWGEHPGSGIPKNHLPYLNRITPGKGYMSTEGGYRLGDWDGHKGGWGDGQSAPFDEMTQAKYMTRYVLEMLRNGYQRSFIYELLDIDQPQWGLFNADGSPKRAASSIRALLGLMTEAQWDGENWNKQPYEPGQLEYTLTELPSTVHSLLFQKGDGRFYLVLWNEVNNWDAKNGVPRNASALPARLSITGRTSGLNVYNPVDAGTSEVATTAASSIDLEILDRPVIVEVLP